MPILGHGGEGGSLALHDVLLQWQTSPFALGAMSVVLALVLAYAGAARRPSPRGHRWPAARTWSFVGAMALTALTLQSGLAVHDDRLSIHIVQHVFLMMLVAPLVALSSPVTLLLRTLRQDRRAAVVDVLNDPTVHTLTGRLGRWLLPLDYYATMALFFFTPWYALSREHLWLHEATHVYFLACGLLFWWPLVGVDPTPWRPSRRLKVMFVALGIPAYGVMGLILAGGGAATGGWVLGVSGVAVTLIGLLFVVGRHRATAPRGSGGRKERGSTQLVHSI